MGWMRGRGLRRRAEEAGFGTVREVYRERADFGAFFVWLAVGLLVALPAALAAQSWWWGLLLSAAVLLPPGLWVYFRPVAVPSGRRWYAVCEGGVVVWSAARGYTTLAWDALTDPGVSGTTRAAVFPSGGARDLFTALRRGRPVRFARTRKLGLAAGVGAWLGAVLAVVVVPWFADWLGSGPYKMRDLSQVCSDRDGSGRAAAYRHEAPRPAALFTDEEHLYLATAGPDRPEPRPEDVQIVGCIQPGERAALALRCPYTGGHAVEYYRAHYRVDVYEARTARPLGSFTVEAAEMPTCPYSHLFGEDTTAVQSNLDPSTDQYTSGLARFVTAPAPFVP